MAWFRDIFATQRFIWTVFALLVIFVVAFYFPALFSIAIGIFWVITVVLLSDILMIFHPSTRILGRRKVHDILSLGEENEVAYQFENSSSFKLSLQVIDEFPEQLQLRDPILSLNLVSGGVHAFQTYIHPVRRGEYSFGDLLVMISGPIGVFRRRIRIPLSRTVKVYPSVIQVKKFEIASRKNLNPQFGVKKIRRIGHSYEFEQIKNYVRGDDYRSINWKATGRHNDLMVNQYTDERAQPVYCVIDKGRSMRTPFHGLSLYDHAINTSLVISNVSLKKGDQIGLISFSDRVETYIPPRSKPRQLQILFESLYAETESKKESNFEDLFRFTRGQITRRSLLMLFTNFESIHSLERDLPLLVSLSKRHLLIIVFFRNPEVEAFADEEENEIEGVYERVSALNLSRQRRSMVDILQRHGIQTVFTEPEELTVNSLNKYFELKSRGLI